MQESIVSLIERLLPVYTSARNVKPKEKQNADCCSVGVELNGCGESEYFYTDCRSMKERNHTSVFFLSLNTISFHRN